MDAVIPASRLAFGRTVLPAPDVAEQPAAAVAARKVVDVGTQAPNMSGTEHSALDAKALQRAMEERLRREFDDKLQSRLAEVRAQARDEGLAAGLSAGKEAAQAQAERLVAEQRAHFAKLLDSLHRSHEQAVTQWQDQIGVLAFEAVCRVVGREFRSKEFVLGVVAGVCRDVMVDVDASIRLHPRDLALVAGDEPTLAVRNGPLKLVADETISLGGCVVETQAGQFDGSLDTQLRRLHAIMAGEAPAQGE